MKVSCVFVPHHSHHKRNEKVSEDFLSIWMLSFPFINQLQYQYIFGRKNKRISKVCKKKSIHIVALPFEAL